MGTQAFGSSDAGSTAGLAAVQALWTQCIVLERPTFSFKDELASRRL